MATLPDVVPVMVLLAVDSEDGDRDGQIGCGTQLGQGAGDEREMVICADGQGRPLLRMRARTRSLVSRAG